MQGAAQRGRGVSVVLLAGLAMPFAAGCQRTGTVGAVGAEGGTSTSSESSWCSEGSGDGGACEWSACKDSESVPGFCGYYSSCFGSEGRCDQAICTACSAVDGDRLGVNLWGNGFCSEAGLYGCGSLIACLTDAGPKLLSPSCATAVAALIEPFLDGGLDGG